jgi:hypothetical protein
MKLTMWGHLNMGLIFGVLIVSASMDKEDTPVRGKLIEGREDALLITSREKTIEGRDRQQPKQILDHQIVERGGKTLKPSGYDYTNTLHCF